jgi:hypothetical protein
VLLGKEDLPRRTVLSTPTLDVALQRAQLTLLLRALRSPFALDIYVWLTYRMSYLQRPSQISWPVLSRQFGSEYGDLRHFRAAFLRHARSILLHYPGARMAATSTSLTLYPSPTHVLPAAARLLD